MNKEELRVGIIGGGASASMAGLILSEAGINVDIFEKSDRILSKVRASGNGRCNLTNEDIKLKYYTGTERDRIGEIISTFDYKKIRNFFEQRGLLLTTLESGRVYPLTLRSDTVVGFFESLLGLHGASIIKNSQIEEIIKDDNDKGFSLKNADEKVYRNYKYLILATGGAYGLAKKDWSNGYSLLKPYGHAISPLHPGIVSLRVKNSDPVKPLSGIKMRAGLSFKGEKIVEDILFTDYGLSGTAIFSFSNVILDNLKKEGKSSISLDLLPDFRKEDLISLMSEAYNFNRGPGIEDFLALYIGQKPAQVILNILDIERDDKLKESNLIKIVDLIKNWEFEIEGTRKNDRGQVTCGGLLLEDIDLGRLESKMIKGLFISGEVMNVQGICGGYNLHWAWASAMKVAKQIIEEEKV